MMAKEHNPYRTAWFLVNRNDVDKELYDIFFNAMQNSSAFRHKELFFKYVIYLYLFGRRRIEPFLSNPTITKMQEGNQVQYQVKTSVAKHYEGKLKKCVACVMELPTKKAQAEHIKLTGHNVFIRIGKREMVTHRFIAYDMHEKAFFDYLLNGKQIATFDFTPLLPPRYRNCNAEELLKEYHKKNGELFTGITMRFKMLKADITDGREEVHGSIVPHMLRHLRAYDLWIVHHMRPTMVQRLLDWSDHKMLYHYSDIREVIKEMQEVEYYRNPQSDGIVLEGRL